MSRTPAERSYKVHSFERGLSVLRAVRECDGPVRNQDIVARTGLPKATASRLMHTLTALGYLRRIDQGSYVLGQASGRSGRAMLEGLRLERFASQFKCLLDVPGSVALLQAHIAGQMVPVYQWTRSGGTLLTHGSCLCTEDEARLAALCYAHFTGNPCAGDPKEDLTAENQGAALGFFHHWQMKTSRLCGCTGIPIQPVGAFVLSLHLRQSDRPSADRIELLGAALLHSAAVIAHDAPHADGNPAHAPA
jgi:hypothetical protein